MAVAFDAVMTGGNGGGGGDTYQVSNANSFSSGGLITVGGSATLLVVTLCFGNGGAFKQAPTAVAVTWNGVSMTNRASVDSSSTPGSDNPYAAAYVFTLVNPTTGSQTLAGSWSGFAQDCYVGAVSFTGTDTTTGVQTSDSTTDTQATSLTITSTTDGATVATYSADGSTPTMNFTTFWTEQSGDPGGGGTYTTGGTSNAHTFTGGSGTRQALAGVHVIAAGGPSSNAKLVKTWLE